MAVEEKINRLRELVATLTPEERKDPEIAAMLRFFAPLLPPEAKQSS